ncbi:MAG: hypothetical protein E4G89_02130, partial [Methanothrix sp.]
MSEVLKNGWLQTAPPGGQHTVELVNANVDGKDFGNTRLAIYGYKFQDSNGNGQKEYNEPYLSGWDIQLKDSSGHLLQTTVTSSAAGNEGRYIFSGLQPGAYKVNEVQQTGWVKTFPAEDCYDVQLSTQAVGPEIFGNNRLAISGVCFLDSNGNGQRDLDDPSLPGWDMQLKDSSGNMLQTATTSSEPGSEGRYEFINLAPGTYRVGEAPRAGWIRTFPQDEDHVVTLTNQPSDGIDFGNRASLSISGMKFEDLNGNSQKDAEEKGLKDWTIRLQSPQITDTATTTGQDGSYQFQNLPP